MTFHNAKVRGVLSLLFLGLLFTSIHSVAFSQTADSSGQAISVSASNFPANRDVPLGNLDASIFNDYIRVMSLPLNERPKAFARLSNQQKATVTRIKLIFQLIDLGELTGEQRKLMTRMISSVSPDIYDRSNVETTRKNDLIAEELEAMTFALFPDRTARAILTAQNAKKEEEIRRIKQFQRLVEINDLEARKALSQMQNEERAAMWKIKLGYHLVASLLNDIEVEFIARFIGELDSVFDSVPKMSSAEREVAAQMMERSISNVFSQKDAINIFYRFGKIEASGSQANSTDGEEIEEGAWSCNCRWYCDGDWQTCRQGGCTDSNYCGPTGTWACTGRCVRR